MAVERRETCDDVGELARERRESFLMGGWSAMQKCALSSALFGRVEVPLALK